MKHSWRIQAAATVLGAFLSACAPGQGPGDVAPDHGTDPGTQWIAPGPTLWEGGQQWFVPDGPFYEAHPGAFEHMSLYYTHVEGDDRPDVGHRGSFGTGNGRVFGFVGLADPLNTLHSLIGPTYERRDQFFGDYELLLTRNEVAVRFNEEWAARSLSSPVLVTRGRGLGLEMDTVDFAPWTDDDPVRDCFVRILRVRNKTDSRVDGLGVLVKPHNYVDTESLPGAMVEAVKTRRLVTAFPGGQAAVKSRSLYLAIGGLDPGEEKGALLTHCAFDEPGAVALPPVFDAGALLDSTTKAFEKWLSGLVKVDLPDPLVSDFWQGALATIRLQIAESGASCPMSEYTRTWMRDNVGPTLALLDAGDFDTVRGMLDYIYMAAVSTGDYQNSYDADLVPDPEATVPDWSSMPGLEGRVAAETPSYFVMMHGWYSMASGDLSWHDQEGRWAFLVRALSAQAFGTDHLLPFTGDETFRAVMNAAFGLELEFPHHLASWSANSSMLWLAAQSELDRLAGLLGLYEETAGLAALRSKVEQGFKDHYVLPDGCISPFVDRETMEPWPAPFEDVSLKLTWSGYMSGDDPAARKAMQCIVDRLGVEPGVIQSPLHESYVEMDLLPVEKGVYTGMKPGYTLAALAEAGHPWAMDAFNAVRTSLSTSGNLGEVHVFDDGSGLTLVYDPAGVLGDYTAKFRPWETGIVADAVFRYLLGWRPDAPDKRIALRPHLPNDWPYMRFEGLRSGDARFDVGVERTGETTWNVKVTSHAPGTWNVSLRWDASSTPTVTVDGGTPPGGAVTVREHFGLYSASTPDQALHPEETIVFVITTE